MKYSMTVILLCVLAVGATAQDKAKRGPSVKDRFESLDARGDHAGIVALWRANPDRVLGTIDSYLEGSLGKIEKAGGRLDDEQQKKIAAMHARAIRGAAAADEAFGHFIFSDYTTSFVGWTAADQKRFRNGQKAFRAARAASRKGNHAEALKAAQLCLDLARPLGDWWGAAMGLSAIGTSKAAAGDLSGALDALQQARLINHDLRLRGSSLRNLKAMLPLLVQTGKKARAIASCQDGHRLARLLGDEKGAAEFEKTHRTLTGKSLSGSAAKK